MDDIKGNNQNVNIVGEELTFEDTDDEDIFDIMGDDSDDSDDSEYEGKEEEGKEEEGEEGEGEEGEGEEGEGNGKRKRKNTKHGGSNSDELEVDLSKLKLNNPNPFFHKMKK